MYLLRRCGRLLRLRARIGSSCRHEKIVDTIHNLNFGGYVIAPYQQILKISNLQQNNLSTDNEDTIRNADGSAFLPGTTKHTILLLRNYIKAQRVRYANVARIVENLDNGTIILNKESSLLLLRCCGDMLYDVKPEARRALTLRVWEMIRNKGYTLSAEDYNTLLSIHAQNSSAIDPEQFLSSMEVAANEDTYQLLLNVTAEAGDYKRAATVMGKMKELGYSANERTFNALVLAHSTTGDVPGAKAVVDIMQTALIKPTAETYAALSRGLAINGDIKSLLEILDNNNFNATQLMSIVKSLSVSGNGAHIPVVLKYLPDTANDSEPIVVNTIVMLTHMGRAQNAFQILNRLPVSAPSVDMSVRFGDFFLREIVRASVPFAQILMISDALISSNKNPLALTKVAEAALLLKNESVALAVFKEMEKRCIEVRPHFYWPLILNCSAHGGEAHVIELTKHMVNSNIALDYDTLCYYVIPNMNLLNPVVTLRKLQDCGVQIADILTPFLSVLLNRGEMKAAVELCSRIKGKINEEDILKPLIHGYNITKDGKTAIQLLSIVSPNAEITNRILLELLVNKKFLFNDTDIVTLVETLAQHKMRISSIVGDVLRQKLSRSIDNGKILAKIEELIDPNLTWTGVGLSSKIPHPREMSTEDLENHLIELKSKQLNTRGVMRRLLQNHCRENNLQRAQELKREIVENGFEWSGGMRASLFNLYVKYDMMAEAVAELRELQTRHKEFQLDEYKVIDFAKTLVEKNELNYAFQILKEAQNVRGGRGVSKNCYRLLNAMAFGREPENTEKLLDLLVSKGYCERSNVLLGPIIRVHLERGDIGSAVKEFKRCVKDYRKTPLQQELICALVRMTDKTGSQNAQMLLQEVMDLVKKIHGPQSTYSQLLMALAETGKNKQLYTLFKTVGITDRALISSVTRLADENKLSALNTILEATRGVPKINKASIYDSLLIVYSRLGDHKGAIDLWEKIQAEDLQPTQKFRKALISLLLSHNVPLPSDLESDSTTQQQASS